MQKASTTTTLNHLYNDIVQHRIAPHLDLLDMCKLSLVSKGTHSIFAKSLQAVKLHRLLHHVAMGEQDKSEKIVKSNPELLLLSGNVTDGSNRLFMHISAFQYAIWALD